MATKRPDRMIVSAKQGKKKLDKKGGVSRKRGSSGAQISRSSGSQELPAKRNDGLLAPVAALAEASLEEAARKRRSLTNPDMVAIAMDRIRGLRDNGSLTPVSDLAKKYRRDPAVISRAVARAFKQNLVEVREVPRSEERERREDLEERLLEMYPHLSTAIVIANSPEDALDDQPGSMIDPLKHRLLQKLGLAMANSIAKGLLRSDDIIGVGSGRGVNLTIRSLVSCPQLRVKNIALMSLTGSVHSKPNRKRGLWLDADRHVLELADFFLHPPNQYLIGHPLAHHPDDLEKARRRTWLADDKSKRPTLALLGVGTIAKEHRFYVEAEAEPSEQEPFLEPIHDLLVRLKEQCEAALQTNDLSHKFPTYSPAAEMSNVFFHVPPPRGVGLIPNEAEIVDCIRDINGRLLNFQRELMNMQLLLVAGSKKKAHALRALLNSDFKVAHLCTDAAAATEIIHLRA